MTGLKRPALPGEVVADHDDVHHVAHLHSQFLRSASIDHERSNESLAFLSSAFKKVLESPTLKATMIKVTGDDTPPYVSGENGSNVLKQMVTVLGQRDMPNPLLVGRPGVGKTAAVEGLAQGLVNGALDPKWIEAIPQLKDAEIWQIRTQSLESDDTEHRGAFEKNLEKLLSQVEKLRKKIQDITES
jgi:ATP-dependent Clp protease ATP-binding subunit ClpA